MELSIVVVLILILIIVVINMAITLLVGSVVVQVMDVLKRLSEEARRPGKKDNVQEKPWYHHL